MRHRARLLSSVTIAVALAISVAVAGAPAWSQALFADSVPVGSNTFTSGVWAVYYLHNNPTPPTGNTNSQANLPMDRTAPTATTLYNYDRDNDSAAGRYVAKGGSLTTTDLTKYQNWRTVDLPDALVINGTVEFEFWSAIKDFGGGKSGDVRVFLRDFNPATSSYAEIANVTVSASNWHGGSNTWVGRTASISVSNYTVQAGHRLEVKIFVGGSAGDDMWFAYDTVAYPTKLTLP